MQNSKNSKYSGVKEKFNMEVMTNYNNHIFEVALNYFKNVKKCVDFGAGIGTLALIFRKKFNINPVCIEIDEDNISYLKKRKFKFFKNLNSAPTENDLIFSSNVLEHIEDDQNTLNLMKKKLKKNGILYLFLPAKMFLWSGMDEAVGHYRRYEFKEIKIKCERAGFKIKKIQYVDSIGFFASLAIKFFGYEINDGLGSKKSIKFYDKYIFPISKIFDMIGFKYLFGKNLLIIAKKS
tara:strand:- start:340 stop:1047 length:708 start_codon:yes stop_codon:yes gene_type:complete